MIKKINPYNKSFVKYSPGIKEVEDNQAVSDIIPENILLNGYNKEYAQPAKNKLKGLEK